MSSKFILVAVMIGFSCSAIFSQTGFPYEKYKARTLSEIVRQNSDVKNADIKSEERGTLINADPLYSLVRVSFLNKSRPISKERKELIKNWISSLGLDKKYIALYENEYLFKECEKEFWIPVQKKVAGYFPKELKTDDMISLYMGRVGGLKAKGAEKWDWLFQVSEFEKY